MLVEMRKTLSLAAFNIFYLGLEILRQVKCIESIEFSVLLGGRGGRSGCCGGHRGNNDAEKKGKNLDFFLPHSPPRVLLGRVSQEFAPGSLFASFFL
jgi:hypothetical protein